MIIADMVAVTGLKPQEIAEKLREFVAIKLRDSRPLDFDQAKAAVYDQLFWPMAAHMAFVVQPSAIVRQAFVNDIAESIPLEHACVADLGCGPAVMLCDILARKPGWRGEGLDVSPAAVDYASRLATHKQVQDRARFSTGNVVDLPFSGASFDLVVASEVLEHVPDIQRALAEIKRVLRPGGRIAITVPLCSRTALHVHSLSGQEYLRRLCERTGLAVRRLETRQYLGFGDDWRHAFLVAEADEDDNRERFAARPEGAVTASVAALQRANWAG